MAEWGQLLKDLGLPVFLLLMFGWGLWGFLSGQLMPYIRGRLEKGDEIAAKLVEDAQKRDDDRMRQMHDTQMRFVEAVNSQTQVVREIKDSMVSTLARHSDALGAIHAGVAKLLDRHDR